MGELERTAWGREVNRLGKQIEHRQAKADAMLEEIRELEGRRDALLARMADDYAEDR